MAQAVTGLDVQRQQYSALANRSLYFLVKKKG
jgi:hypothetical protein